MAYKIKLDVFEGPLDLLLHLIRESQVDIYDIPISTITEQYLEYLDIMQDLNLEIAGEYLLMAATLTYIKSKMLLPKVESDDEETDEFDGEDPRDMLVQKLIEYKKFKEAALKLRERELDQAQVFTRTPSEADMPGEADLLLEVSVLELLRSFKKILDRLGDKAKRFNLTLEEISVTDKLNEIMERLESREFVTFDSLFASARNRMEVIATFLATLELVRLKLIKAHQSRAGGELLIYKVADASETFTESDFDRPADIDDDLAHAPDEPDDDTHPQPSAADAEDSTAPEGTD
ncbi:MAG: segregation/condensation protein A [Nitrospinae bacterium]|nr:segregation/condensation protein A [Nitrospinota bacterium]